MNQSTATAIWIGVAVLGAVISGGLAHRKGRSAFGYALLGFLVPLVGVIVALVVSDRSQHR